MSRNDRQWHARTPDGPHRLATTRPKDRFFTVCTVWSRRTVPSLVRHSRVDCQPPIQLGRRPTAMEIVPHWRGRRGDQYAHFLAFSETFFCPSRSSPRQSCLRPKGRPPFVFSRQSILHRFG